MVFFTVDALCCGNNKICYAVQHRYHLLDYFQDKKDDAVLISEYKKNQTFRAFDYLSSFVDSMLILILVDTIASKLTGNENEYVPSTNYQLIHSTK